jgi:hypothetical protein
MNYIPERFSSTYENSNGESIWNFLNQSENLVRMDSATYLSRPAIEVLSPQLIQEFGAEIKSDRLKQMIGHMVRQIMEYRGYQVDRSNVKIRAVDNIFSKATRYILKKS